jgi:hypothetical protein
MKLKQSLSLPPPKKKEVKEKTHHSNRWTQTVQNVPSKKKNE